MYYDQPPGLKRWWASRKYFPKYLCYCPFCFRMKCCDDRTNADKIEDLKTSCSDYTWFDGHSISHVFWGILTSIPLFFVEWYISMCITFSAAVGFELIENSALGVKMSNMKLCYLCDQNAPDGEYKGDNIYNSLTDVFCNMLGFVILFCVKLLYDL